MTTETTSTKATKYIAVPPSRARAMDRDEWLKLYPGQQSFVNGVRRKSGLDVFAKDKVGVEVKARKKASVKEQIVNSVEEAREVDDAEAPKPKKGKKGGIFGMAS